jgi:molecular chaperone DnaK (HSP70)
LWSHATETIKSKIGQTLWENLAIRIVLTVPAIWDHQAQELTRKSAEMAGLMARKNTTLELIGEPEAAALAVFDDIKLQKERRLKV